MNGKLNIFSAIRIYRDISLIRLNFIDLPPICQWAYRHSRNGMDTKLQIYCVTTIRFTIPAHSPPRPWMSNWSIMSHSWKGKKRQTIIFVVVVGGGGVTRILKNSTHFGSRRKKSSCYRTPAATKFNRPKKERTTTTEIHRMEQQSNAKRKTEHDTFIRIRKISMYSSVDLNA